MEDRVSNLRQHVGTTGQATLEMLRTAPDQILQISTYSFHEIASPSLLVNLAPDLNSH